jgi:hypothetical protein
MHPIVLHDSDDEPAPGSPEYRKAYRKELINRITKRYLEQKPHGGGMYVPY